MTSLDRSSSGSRELDRVRQQLNAARRRQHRHHHRRHRASVVDERVTNTPSFNDDCCATPTPEVSFSGRLEPADTYCNVVGTYNKRRGRIGSGPKSRERWVKGGTSIRARGDSLEN